VWGSFAIVEEMPVYDSCGTRVGTVAGVEQGSIRLACDASAGGGERTIPRCWVDSVGRSVRLSRPSRAVAQDAPV
jgi:hypothetical protein